MKRRLPRRGFTIILAVVLLGLIAVAAAMIVHQLGYELRRTRAAYEDAQLRQLLLAGAQEVATNPAAATTQPVVLARRVELPPDLASQGASILISQGISPDDILIVAKFGGREASQTLHLDHESRHWSVLQPSE